MSVNVSWSLIAASRTNVTSKTCNNKSRSVESGLCRESIFRRKAKLVDLARKYRRVNAELLLDLNDERTLRLPEIYCNEGCPLEEEIRQLARSTD